MKNQQLFKQVNDRRGQARGTWQRMLILMALLLTAGVLLWRGSVNRLSVQPQSAVTPAPTQEAAAAPKTGRSARELAYEKDVGALTALINDAKAGDAIIDQAAEQLAKMVEHHQIELGLEEALTKAGFDPCMVLLQNDALTVTVSAGTLTPTESSTILAVCAAHSDVAVDNIRIMTGVQQ